MINDADKMNCQLDERCCKGILKLMKIKHGFICHKCKITERDNSNSEFNWTCPKCFESLKKQLQESIDFLKRYPAEIGCAIYAQGIEKEIADIRLQRFAEIDLYGRILK